MQSVDVRPLRVSGWLRYGGRELHVINFTYVVSDPARGQALIVDPAWEPDAIERVVDGLGVPLTACLLTHSHFDHVNLADFLVGRHGLDVYMSDAEIRRYGFTCRNLRPIVGAEPFVAAGLQVTPLHTPGHSAGSTCYLIGDNLFSGDTLFTEGCGMCSGRGADPKAMFESIGLLRARCRGSVRVFPGHSFGEQPGQTFESLLRTNVYLNMRDYEQFRAFRMREHQPRLFDFK
jgi:glyoxylase-like metal-dependent hydrolase (beta-lactamase superfamily II)